MLNDLCEDETARRAWKSTQNIKMHPLITLYIFSHQMDYKYNCKLLPIMGMVFIEILNISIYYTQIVQH